jgi:uncharacterized protein YqeY
MGLREQLTADLKEAMRQQDQVRKRTIRSVIAAIKTGETELDSRGERVILDEQGILGIVTKEAKQRRESIAEYEKAGRQDLVEAEEAELAILEAYLPQQLSRDKIEARAREVIEETGASGMHDIGKVMRPLVAELRGQADGREINEVVRELLSGASG